MKVHFLGTGSATSKYRNNSSLLLETNEKNYLIDCSGAIVQNIEKSGVDINKTNDIIITHAHIDHIFAIPSIIHYKWLNKIEEITIYALNSVVEIIKHMVVIHGLDLKKSPIKINYKEIQNINNFKIFCGIYEISTFKTNHGFEPSFGIKVINKSNESNFVFTSDAIADKNISNVLDSQTKYLIHDCGAEKRNSFDHGGAVEINSIIKYTSIKKVYLHHFSDLDTNKLQQIINITKEDFEGEVLIAKDFLQFTL